MSHTFDRFDVRKVEEKDRPYLKEIIAKDPYHQWNMTPDFFLKLRRGEDAWAIEDEQGNVVLYFKTQTAVRFSCIFSHYTTRQEKAANVQLMRSGLKWIRRLLARNGYCEIITDTESPELEKFTKLILGFSSLRPQLSKLVPTADIPRGEENSLNTYKEFSGKDSDDHVRIQ